MSNLTQAQIPSGFKKAPGRGPFFDGNGPFWHKPGQDGRPPIFGLRPEARHTNSLGFLHGGMIATFLDSAMAQSVYEQHACRLVTLDLNISYKHVVPQGRWVEAETTLSALSENIVEASVSMSCRNTICATATGKFQLFPDRQPGTLD